MPATMSYCGASRCQPIGAPGGYSLISAIENAPASTPAQSATFSRSGSRNAGRGGVTTAPASYDLPKNATRLRAATPRIFYMHVHGHGKPMDLARKMKPALDLIGKGASRPAGQSPTPAAPPAAAMDTARIAQIVGQQGEQTGAVYKITVGRDDLKVTEMGAPVNARMGLNTWAAFVGTSESAAIAGDVAMLANEVTPVLKTLRKNDIDVVAIHQHMTTTQPTIYFLHYWGTGPADKLATGFKAALGELGKTAKSTAAR